MANNAPFLFSPETFDALCSDLSRVRLSEAVAASAAFPLVFTPIVLEAHQGKCTYREPDWLTAARYNPEATAAALHVEAQAAQYAALLEQEAAIVNRPSAQRYTQQLADADRR